jgi:hypothetical protein
VAHILNGTILKIEKVGRQLRRCSVIRSEPINTSLALLSVQHAFSKLPVSLLGRAVFDLGSEKCWWRGTDKRDGPVIDSEITAMKACIGVDNSRPTICWTLFLELWCLTSSRESSRATSQL